VSTGKRKFVKAPEARGVGRPPGKRTDPEYRQVGAWVRKATYDRTRIALIEHGNREFSELVEELLQSWLGRNEHKGGKH
jgi:hypothetical protein